jgi:hypothetical protein
LDARAQEANSSSRKAMDAFYQARSAEDAKKAAVAGLISAIAGAGSGIAGAASSSSANGFTIFSAALKGAFSIASAIVALVGAGEEAKLAQAQARTLSDEAKQDQNNVRALDGNPSA